MIIVLEALLHGLHGGLEEVHAELLEYVCDFVCCLYLISLYIYVYVVYCYYLCCFINFWFYFVYVLFAELLELGARELQAEVVALVQRVDFDGHLGDSNNTVRGYCLGISLDSKNR